MVEFCGGLAQTPSSGPRVANAKAASLSIITGRAKCVEIAIPADPLYSHLLAAAAAASRNGAIHFVDVDWRQLPELMVAARPIYVHAHQRRGDCFRGQHVRALPLAQALLLVLQQR
jgi:hypothetical protein